MAKYALVVGISKYRDANISDLPYAARDAEGMGACLETDCEFEDVKVIKSREGAIRVSGSDIGLELARIADAIGPDDTFVFYFAGHGMRSGGQSRFLTSDDTLRMPEISLGYDQLRDALSKVKCAQQVLIFDCCRGDSRHSRGGEKNLTSSGFVRDIKTLFHWA